MHAAARELGAIILASIVMSGSQVSAADGDKFFTHLHTDKAMANVTLSPARKGPVEIAIQLETLEEKPLVATAVSVTLSNGRTKGKPMIVAAERRGEDRWLAKVTVPTAGRWMLGLGVTLSETEKVSIEAPILIK